MITNTNPGSAAASTLGLQILFHDLSAPARHVQFLLAQLIESLPDPTPSQAAWLRGMQENLFTQRSLLGDARDLLAHEPEASVAWEQPVRASVALDDVIASFRPVFEEHGLVLRVDLSSDPPLVVDPHALARVVSNLLGNALKATPRGGTVTLASRLEGPTMVFSVSDTGDGITFEEPAGSPRQDDSERGASPSDIWGGLGLLVCHSIVMRYGGHLSMVSPGPGLGSTFSFGLRVATEHNFQPLRSTKGPDDNDTRTAGSAGLPPLREASIYAV